MLKFLIKKGASSSTSKDGDKEQRKFMKTDLKDLHVDPNDRKSIDEYHVNQRDEIRRAYLINRPFQPKNHNFKVRDIGCKPRRFVASWFDDYKYWLEYSVKEEAAFCLCCYLFKS